MSGVFKTHIYIVLALWVIVNVAYGCLKRLTLIIES